MERGGEARGGRMEAEVRRDGGRGVGRRKRREREEEGRGWEWNFK